MSEILVLQNGRYTRISDRIGGANKRPRVAAYNRAKRERNSFRRELEFELSEIQAAAVCSDDEDWGDGWYRGDGWLLRSEKEAVDKIVARLGLEPSGYTAKFDFSSGDVHIRLSVDSMNIVTTLVVHEGRLSNAISEELEEPDEPQDPYSFLDDLLDDEFRGCSR
jgi:hypothetical protein